MSGVATFKNVTLTKKLNLTNNKIIMYSGNNLPVGYVWCDGNNSTPDLTNKFIYGINSGSTGDFGNSEINSIPKHDHTLTATREKDTVEETYTDINYQRLKSDAITTTTITRGQKGGGGSITHKDHNHNVNNNDGSTSKGLGETIDVIVNNSTNNNINTEYNNMVNEGISDSNFNQKYVYIGFIMKDPTA